MNLDALVEIVDRQLLSSYNSPLKHPEKMILQGTWAGKTYTQIAEEVGYSAGYLTNVVAPELCQRLSALIGERVTKKNCRMLLESFAAAQVAPSATRRPTLADLALDSELARSPHYPSGSVPLDSPVYLERSSVKEQIYREIRKPGALIRIKAPREMGKTSLLLRTLDYADRLGYRTVSLNLEQTDQEILSDPNRFLRWFCANVTRQLELEPKLDDYWDEEIGGKVSCSLYFRNYLLEKLDTPLVLALDEVNQVFEHPQVAKDFLPLLRFWYEEAKRQPIWQKLRLIVVHSTEIYVPLQMNQSPFNVGLPIQLNTFSQEEVQQLAQCYGLDWEDGEEARHLMDMVGGHPALVHTALYHLSRGEGTLAQLLETAPTATGIYSHHLQRHWVTLEQQPELISALHDLMSAIQPVPLDPILAHKLSSLGLIKQSGDKAIPSCKLYRQYFKSCQAGY